MSAVTNTPSNRNFLSNLNFRMVLERAPTVSFFIQSFSLPGLTFEGAMFMPTPILRVPLPGDHLSFAPLTVSFAVDEDMSNYLEIFNWMSGIAGPTTITPGEPNQRYGLNNSLESDPLKAIRSDIKILVLTSSKNPNMEITFRDAFPSALGELSFNTTSPSINYLESSVTFEYLKYEIVKL